MHRHAAAWAIAASFVLLAIGILVLSLELTRGNDALRLALAGREDSGGQELRSGTGREQAPPRSAARGSRMPVAEVSPRVSLVSELADVDVYVGRQRTLVIRHVSGDEVVALIEIVSRGNKASRGALARLVDKAVAALQAGYDLVLVDLHPGA